MAQVEAIHIARGASTPMQSLDEVEAVVGGGLAGDRYLEGIGFYSERGVRLSDLLERRFHVGDVLLEGVKDCPPCDHLQELVGKPVLQPLVNRGGLRARVVVGGVLKVGDRITAVESVAALNRPTASPVGD